MNRLLFGLMISVLPLAYFCCGCYDKKDETKDEVLAVSIENKTDDVLRNLSINMVGSKPTKEITQSIATLGKHERLTIFFPIVSGEGALVLEFDGQNNTHVKQGCYIEYYNTKCEMSIRRSDKGTGYDIDKVVE